MSPPSFHELHKLVSDIFSKGYNLGIMQFHGVGKTLSGIDFTTSQCVCLDKGNDISCLEAKFNIPECGLHFENKWVSCNNTIFAHISNTDQFLKGLKLTFEGSFRPKYGNVNSVLKASYANDLVKTDIDIDLPISKIYASTVFGYNKWLAGYQITFYTMGYDILMSNSFSLGYSNKDVTINSNLKDGDEILTSIYHTVNKELTYGIQCLWKSPVISWCSCGSHKSISMNFGTVWNIQKDTIIRFKLSNTCKIGFAIQQQLWDGVYLNLSTLIDGTNFMGGTHKVGIALRLET